MKNVMFSCVTTLNPPIYASKVFTYIGKTLQLHKFTVQYIKLNIIGGLAQWKLRKITKS